MTATKLDKMQMFKKQSKFTEPIKKGLHVQRAIAR